MKVNLSRLPTFLAIIGLTALLAGCGSDSHHSSPNATYDVEVTNLTANQPLSPLAVILHKQGYIAWQAGSAASDGLEQLAEGGAPDAFLDEADSSPEVLDTQAGTTAILPGQSANVTVHGPATSSQVTIATMLVNSNDAFTGTAGQTLATLKVGQTLTLDVPAYDAGTEANSETAASVPGPAAGGEGYNPQRNDRDIVIVHPGIISVDDGLVNSALHESHRIQNPVARLAITRSK